MITGIDPLYQYYALKSGVWKDLQYQSSDKTVSLVDTVLEILRIHAPSEDVQREVGTFLKEYDVHVETLRLQLQHAQGFLKDLFAQRVKPQGIQGRLGDVARLRRETIQPSACSEDVCYVGLEDMTPSTLLLNAGGDVRSLSSTKRVFRGGDILLGRLRPYLRKMIVAPSRGVCSTDILVVYGKDAMWHNLLIGLFLQDSFWDYCNAHATGLSMPRIKWDVLCAYPLPMWEDERELQEVTTKTLHDLFRVKERLRFLQEIQGDILESLIRGTKTVDQCRAMVEM